MNSLSDILYECDTCTYKTTTHKSYTDHLMTDAHMRNENKPSSIHIPISKIKSDDKYKCTYCNQPYKAQGNCDRHMKTCKIYKNLIDEVANSKIREFQLAAEIKEFRDKEIKWTAEVREFANREIKWATDAKEITQQLYDLKNKHDRSIFEHKYDMDNISIKYEKNIIEITKKHMEELKQNTQHVQQQLVQQPVQQLIQHSVQQQSIQQSVQQSVQQPTQQSNYKPVRHGDNINNGQANSNNVNSQFNSRNNINVVHVQGVKYLTENYPSAPLLKVFEETAITNICAISEPQIVDDIVAIYKPEYNSEDDVATMAKRDTAKGTSKYLADIIVKEYVKDKPNDQSMWNTDKNRNHYVVKSTVLNSEKWIEDNEAKYIIATIVKPLLLYMIRIVQDARIIISTRNLSTKDSKVLQDGNDALNVLICLEIYLRDSENTSRYVAKHLSPSFTLHKIDTGDEPDEIDAESTNVKLIEKQTDLEKNFINVGIDEENEDGPTSKATKAKNKNIGRAIKKKK
ncbi:MAG: hypothetical protein Faunusvirus47_6 [Faunusvirus sp.]|jgi:hypothetical protein|uniref:C2H2-type domain-containing protein n=1 Tax=Faunusvirus sp. TaxID=2487766 RepID=A0A3G4ZXX0_9VIRU|nr:MAG: hypothetical protein Faunusvirus47_6 [Faunusvirus sp.]